MAIMLPSGQCAPPVYNHPNDLLAGIIAKAWVNSTFKSDLLNATKATLQKEGVFLDKPVVIDEAKHNKGYKMQSDDEIVFVLPDAPKKASNHSKKELLETARIKMAYTACGI